MKKVTHLTTALFLLTAGWNQATAQTITGQEKALKAEDITQAKSLPLKESPKQTLNGSIGEAQVQVPSLIPVFTP